MGWEFTPQQVVKGEEGYGLEAFRHDLMQEVAPNVPGAGGTEQRQIYAKTAAYGHFGREELEFTWEATDKAEALRADAGV